MLETKARFSIYRVVLFLMLAMMSACSSTNPASRDLTGEQAPPALFTLASGERVGIKSFEGRPVVVLFWGLQCSHSKQLLSRLEQSAKRLVERFNAVVIAANLDLRQDEQKVIERYASIPDDIILKAFSGDEAYDEAYRAFCGESTPFLVVIDRTGKILRQMTSDKDLENLLAAEQG